MDINKNYYHILGVDKNSNIEDIKSNYRKLALKYHPDKNKGDKIKENKFKEISAAYDVLGDVNKKQKYDTQSPHGNSYNPNPFANIGGFDDILSFFNSGDIFSNFGSFFGAKNEYREFHENLDISINLIITLNDIYKGKPIKIAYKKFVHCDDCKGTGFDHNSQSYDCEICNGTGKDMFGRKCQYCQGVGKIFTSTCSTCNGEKTILKDFEFNLTNIENIRASETKYLKGFGHQSKYFRERIGNVKLNIIYQEIGNHKIVDNKLYYYLNLHYEDAIKGNKYEYKTLDDHLLNISIPKKTNDGDIIKIKNKGLLNNKNEREDLYFKINIIIDYNRI